MRIGIDILGGDYAPEAVVEGAILAAKELEGEIKFVLIGNEDEARKIIAKKQINDLASFEFVHTTDAILMGEHPAKAFARKPKSSIALGYGLLAQKKIDGFASAGNTGAMLAGAMFTVKQTPGIVRPAIAAMVPQENDKTALLLDVGLNPDCKPDVLYQYAIIGSLYASEVMGKDNPRVGLLNIGSEKEKGNLLTKSTYDAMSDTMDFNFIGNIEGTDIFDNTKADVIVCDGFVGNVVLKEAEALYTIVKKRGITDKYFERFNFENIGGTPILGINAPVVIGHGISNDIAIKNMIMQTVAVVEAKLPEKLKSAFKKYFDKA